jgi:F-type H+-transporting ATPase subunit gamma
MASLKEIKGRIGSVKSTLKITSAMKVVASTKLHRAQIAIENMLPYDRRLSAILHNFLDSGIEIESPYVDERKPEKVAIVTFASNSSLCGGFNSGVIRHTLEVLREYAQLEKKDLLIYPVGRKIAQALAKDYQLIEDYKQIGDKPSYQQAAELAEHLMQLYVSKKIDRVELLYMHYKSTASQIMTRETFLPLQITPEQKGADGIMPNYIIEPSVKELVKQLIPQALRMKMYTVLLDSNASEHAARTVAMQQATDNANDLLQDLSLMYNKGRQQAITTELLDIIGGSMK